MGYLSRALVLSLIFVVCACGDNTKRSTIKYQSNVSLLESEKTIVDANSKVLLDSKTPEGLGLLLSKKGDSVDLCTTFMMTENIAVTNASCLKSLRAGDTCGDKIAVTIQTSTGIERRLCKKIIVASQVEKGSYINPDYVSLELDHPIPGVKLAEFSREGISDNEVINVEIINSIRTDSGFISGFYQKNFCSAHANSLVGNFVDRKSSIVPLFERENNHGICEFNDGNSGSPVRNARGKIVGVIFAAKKNESVVLSTGKTLPSYAIATNLSCMKLGVATLDKDIDPSCEKFREEESSYQERQTEKMLSEVRKSIDSRAVEIMEKLPSSFEYVPKFEDRHLRFEIKCVKDLSLWGKEELKLLKSKGLLSRKKSYSRQISYYNFTVKTEIDKFLRPSFSPILEWESYDTISIPFVEKIMKDGEGEVMITSDVLGKAISLTRTLKLCGEHI